MEIFKGGTYDEERALYGIHGACVEDCVFDGAADGESALKECGSLTVKGCDFNLRYPLWHTDRAEIISCGMSETCRAALWYCNDVRLSGCGLMGIKALRECDRTELEDCTVSSTEFGWFCRGMRISSCRLSGEYPFLMSSGIAADGLEMNSKYSFQYVSDVNISNSVLNTKDAFWHGRNVTVTDSEMHGADLAFEYSDVTARLRGGLVSVKNPISGMIEAESIGEIILDEHMRKGSDCIIKCTATAV